MKSNSLWAALIIAGLVAVMTVSAGMAAPPAQDPTLTATPTATGFGPTPTPTNTLQPPPSGGGLVEVYTLAVRIAPNSSATPLGGLVYSTAVYPIGRSVSGNWVAIDWYGQVGWIFADLVEWDPDVDLSVLPTLIPPVTGTPVVATETQTPRPTATPRPRHTETPAPSLTPASTDTPAPSETPAPTDTPLPAVVAVNPGEAEAPADDPESGPSPSLPGRKILPWLALGVPLALLALYGVRFAAGERETRRYAKLFPLQTCPVCQAGSLSLEESIQRPFGVAHVTRTVRCDTCHSVLRQVKPGVWRYTIDPVINPSLAAEFNGRQFSDVALTSFAAKARMYEPQMPEVAVETLAPLTDEEILADLEARIPPPEPDEPMELAAEETEPEANTEESPQEDQPLTD